MFNDALKAEYGQKTVQDFYQRFMVDLEHFESLDMELTRDLLWMIDASQFKAAILKKVLEHTKNIAKNPAVANFFRDKNLEQMY